MLQYVFIVCVCLSAIDQVFVLCYASALTNRNKTFVSEEEDGYHSDEWNQWRIEEEEEIS
jgi:hypothetical protein